MTAPRARADSGGTTPPASAESLPARRAVQLAPGLPDPLPWVRGGGLDVRYLDHCPSMARPAETISVVVASWNSEGTLPACVSAIARSAALLAGECAVEIIVVDDGSARPAADALVGVSDTDLQVIRVAHGGQTLASNTGALHATGELLLFCDSDMLLNPWTLHDIRQAIACWPDALCFGFREDVAATDPRIDPSFFSAGPGLTSALHLTNDNRFTFDTPGVPMHLFAATSHLRDLQGFRHIRPPGRSSWWLSRMAYGCILACSRSRFLQLGGMDGRFSIWGFNDTELATRWIASGGVLLPVFTANGLHVRHPPRNPRQWRDAGLSRIRYELGLSEPWPREHIATSDVLSVRRLPGSRRVSPRPPEAERWESRLTMPAASLVGDRELWQERSGVPAEDALGDERLSAMALRVLRLSTAPEYLEAASGLRSRPAQAGAALERALLAMALGDTVRAQADLALAAADPSRTGGGTARYLLAGPAQRLWRIAEQHAGEGLTRAAASGFLACRVASGGERYPQVSERISVLPRSDRRVF